MSRWFRRTSHQNGPSAVGLLESEDPRAESQTRAGAAYPQMVGDREYAWQCDTLDQQRHAPTASPEAANPADDAELDGFPESSAGTDPQLIDDDDRVPNERRPAPAVLPSAASPWSLTADSALPGGAIGGVPFGGGLPGDHGPLFGPNAVLAEMPWRAAGGEAHPMTAIGAARPVAASLTASTAEHRPVLADAAEEGGSRSDDTDELPVVAGPNAEEPTARATIGEPAPATQRFDGPLLIFEQLLRETSEDDRPAPPDVDWDEMINRPPVSDQGRPSGELDSVPARRRPADHDEELDWCDVLTLPLPVIGSRPPARITRAAS